MLVTATNNSLHHTQYNSNYGLYFRFWDMVCGTELKTTTTLFKEIHERKNEQVVDNTKYKTILFDRIEKETSDAVSIYFKPDDKEFYNYEAGQYLTLKVKIKNKTYDRCFSLSSTLGVDNFLRITVKLKGDVSNYFMHEAKVGDSVLALYLVGDFVMPRDTSNTPHFVFVARGSGITPLFSMMRKLLVENADTKITLLYANKTEDSIIFRQQLLHLAAMSTRVSYKEFISGKNRIEASDLKFEAGSQFYICGPDSLKKATEKNLKANGVSANHINIEHFADGYVRWFGLI